jgi:hypothetical protein
MTIYVVERLPDSPSTDSTRLSFITHHEGRYRLYVQCIIIPSPPSPVEKHHSTQIIYHPKSQCMRCLHLSFLGRTKNTLTAPCVLYQGNESDKEGNMKYDDRALHHGR